MIIRLSKKKETKRKGESYLNWCANPNTTLSPSPPWIFNLNLSSSSKSNAIWAAIPSSSLNSHFLHHVSFYVADNVWILGVESIYAKSNRLWLWRYFEFCVTARDSARKIGSLLALNNFMKLVHEKLLYKIWKD